jgi:hypothetical protein
LAGGEGKGKPYVVEDSAYAYVDARAGSLVFGRDTTRGGAMLNGPNWIEKRPGLGCPIDFGPDPNTRAPNETRIPARPR